MAIINLTPHPLSIIDANGEARSFPKPDADAVLPRVGQTTIQQGEIEGIADYKSVFGEPEYIPFNDGEKIYVVSRLVISACEKHGIDHSHLRSPGRLLRDEEGKVVGADGLAR
jgi:hypothetical protein